MSDLISRQAAIDKINERQRKLIYCFGFENDMVKIMDIARSIIIAMPSEQPEIIRCKDCAHRSGDYCHRFHDGYSAFIHHEDYCRYAERRTDE